MVLGTLAIIAIAGGGAGLGLQMKGQYEAGRQAEAKAKSEAAWQKYNAELADREAIERQESAAVEERKHRKAGERKKARLRTQIGKAGILPIGSVELIGEELVSELEEDALQIRRGGQVGAQRLTAEAQLSRFAGRSALLRGKAARRAGRLGAIGTGLTGASRLAFAAIDT